MNPRHIANIAKLITDHPDVFNEDGIKPVEVPLPGKKKKKRKKKSRKKKRIKSPKEYKINKITGIPEEGQIIYSDIKKKSGILENKKSAQILANAEDVKSIVNNEGNFPKSWTSGDISWSQFSGVSDQIKRFPDLINLANQLPDTKFNEAMKHLTRFQTKAKETIRGKSEFAVPIEFPPNGWWGHSTWKGPAPMSKAARSSYIDVFLNEVATKFLAMAWYKADKEASIENKTSWIISELKSGKLDPRITFDNHEAQRREDFEAFKEMMRKRRKKSKGPKVHELPRAGKVGKRYHELYEAMKELGALDMVPVFKIARKHEEDPNVLMQYAQWCEPYLGTGKIQEILGPYYSEYRNGVTTDQVDDI